MSNAAAAPEKEFDDNLLFTTQRFGDITVKQLSFGELGLITNDLVALYDLILKEYMPLITGTTPAEIVKIIILLLPQVAPVMAKVCNVPLETINGLSATEGVKLAKVIWKMNEEIITNFFGIASSLKLAPKKG